FCNDRFYEIYGLGHGDVTAAMTGHDWIELGRQHGHIKVTAEELKKLAFRPEGFVVGLPSGRSVVIKFFRLPNGGASGVHEDCAAQRKRSQQLAATKQFLESVLDNVRVCVAAKSIEDGSYIFANRAYEDFWQFSRDYVVGKRAADLFHEGSAAKIEAA